MKNILFLILNFCVANIFAQTTTTLSTSGSGTGSWTVPCGVSSITVDIWGGGGAGGGDGSNNSIGGAGGGSGAYVTSVITVTGGVVYSYTVGAGGIGSTGNGTAGGATTFGSMLANGGLGGLANSATATGTVGGSGGTSTNGTIGAGGGVNGGVGGTAPGSGGGTGGAGGTAGSNGVDGSFPGGGGGGADDEGGSANTGGNGGIGKLTIRYTTPPTNSAGSNQTLANCATTTNLAATALTSGWAGYWTCQSNCAGAAVTTPTSPTSGVTGLSPGTTTTLLWTTTYSTGCYITNTITVTSPLGSPCNTVVPTNNACASAIPITLGTQVSGSTLNSTNDIYSGIGVGAGSCTNNGNVWYSFTTPNTTPLPCYTIQQQWNSGCNTMIITSGCSASAIGLNQSNNIYNDYSSTENSTAFAPNTTYYISVGAASQGPFTFSVVAKPQAANDVCSGAQGIGTTPSLTDNAAAGCEYTYVPAQDANVAPATLCASSLENISWFTFTAVSSGTVSISLQNILCNNGGGGFQTGLLTGSCSSPTIGTSGAAVCIAASSGTVTYNITSAVAGQTYLIGMDGNAGSDCHFYISGTNIVPLPIELTMFNAKLNGNYVDLIWSTATEKNNDYFTIERSIDGINFEAIGVVKGAGNSVTEKYYSFQDKYPLVGTSYYRLKQTDFSKESSYSVIQSISIDEKTKFDFKLFPNPSDKNEDIRLQFFGKENDLVNVLITDLTGNILSEKDIKLTSSATEIALKHHFNAGIYFIKVSNKFGEVINQKFIVE